MKKILIVLILIAAVIYGGTKIFTNNRDQLAAVMTTSQRVVSGTVSPLSVATGGTLTVTLTFAQPYSASAFPLAAEFLGYDPVPMTQSSVSGNTVTFTAQVPSSVTPGQYEFSAINTSNRTVAWVLGDGATMVTVTAAAPVVTTPAVATLPAIVPNPTIQQSPVSPAPVLPNSTTQTMQTVNPSGLSLVAQEYPAPTFTSVPNYNTTTYYNVSWSGFDGGIKCDRVITPGVQMYSASEGLLKTLPASGFSATTNSGNQMFALYSNTAKQVVFQCSSVANPLHRQQVLFNVRSAIMPAAPVISSITPTVISRQNVVGKNFIVRGVFPSNPNNPHRDSWINYKVITEPVSVSPTKKVEFATLTSLGSLVLSTQLNSTNKSTASFRIKYQEKNQAGAFRPASLRQMPVGTYRIRLQNIEYPQLESNTITVTITE